MKERGVILLSVLWVVMILSIISLSLAAAVRTEVASSQDSFDLERAFFMARGAAEIMYQDLTSDRDVFAGAPVERFNDEYLWSVETGEVRVRLESGRGLIDINAASDVLLASMFDSLGVEQDIRNRLVDSILDWIDADDTPHLYGSEVMDYELTARRRLPANRAFESVDELLFVNGLTREVFYGRLAQDPISGGYRRVPGIRELVTTSSGSTGVNPNEASLDVLAALPGVSRALAESIVKERENELFDNQADLVGRLPEVSDREMLNYITFDDDGPATIVANARVLPSGVSRTVRLILRKEERLQFLSMRPLFYRRVQDLKLDRWQYE